MNQKFKQITAKAKTLSCSPVFPFVIYGLIMLTVHLFINLGWGDDHWFRSAISPFSFSAFADMLKYRYMHWTSRIVIESVLFPIAHMPMLWRIADTLVMLLIAFSLSRIFNPENRTYGNWIIVFLLLVFPFASLLSAGWIATTLNYSWPLAFGLFALLPVVNHIRNKHTPAWLFVLTVPALIYAVNHEQMCAVMLAAFAGVIFYLIIQKKKIPAFLIAQTILCCASLVFIFTCPGNSQRLDDEIVSWFPTFNQLSFLQKAELGFSSTMQQIIMKHAVIFTVFCVFLIIAVFTKTEKSALRAVSCIPLAATLIFGLCGEITSMLFPNLLSLREQIGETGTGFSLTVPRTWLPDIIFVLVLACIFISLLTVFKKSATALLSCYLIAVGFASRIIMGFSPTVWVSRQRTFTLLYFSFIAVAILLFDSFKQQVFQNGKQKKALIVCMGASVPFILEDLLTSVLYYQ